MRMKALKSFFGNEGRVKAGREFAVANRYRADDLERRGLAVPLCPVAAGPAGAEIVNRAAESGPLSGPHGGETGAAEPSSSSRPDQAQRTKPKPSEDGEESIAATSSSSTSPGVSSRKRTSATAATERGGERAAGSQNSAA